MDMTTSLAASLLAVLAALAFAGWMLARAWRHHTLRREQAQRLLQALERHAQWIGAQRMNANFTGESREAAAALDQACTLRQAWFPDLAGDMAELLAVHNRLLSFLATQQALWQRDPEHWLQSDHDARFMALWRQHRFALQALQAKLEHATSLRIPNLGALWRESTYA